MKLVYFSAAGLMAIFAAVMAFTLGWLWGLALLGAAVTLVFMAMAKDDEGPDGDRHAR